MATAAIVPVSEYLSTMYHPDCDYVDGQLLERNVGEEAHGEIQAILAGIFQMKKAEWNVRVLTEVRLQLSETRYRIPDVCVVPSWRPRGRILQYAPLICIEILSPEDRLGRMQQRVNDYAAIGVENIWIVDPQSRVGYYASRSGFRQPEDAVLQVPGTEIALLLDEIFAELDS